MLKAVTEGIGVRQLGKAHADFLNAWLGRYENAFSKHRRAGAARAILRKLWEEERAAKLHDLIVKVTPPRPRNVTATDAERAALLGAAPPHLRLWLLLCSDTAIRSGTAAKLGPDNYDPATQTITFRTKYQHAQRFQVTNDIALMVSKCKGEGPWVAQMRPQGTATYHQLANDLAALKKRLGITRKLTPHDLRRTTARKLYAITKDLRDVQSLLGHSELRTTMWYLQDETQVVSRSNLELAKLNPNTETIQ